jgi:hypothetical protein
LEDEIGTLRVEVTTEALELRREEHRIRLRHLKHRQPATRPDGTDGAMGSGDSIEREASSGLPALQRRGAHLAASGRWESESVGMVAAMLAMRSMTHSRMLRCPYSECFGERAVRA